MKNNPKDLIGTIVEVKNKRTGETTKGEIVKYHKKKKEGLISFQIKPLDKSEKFWSDWFKYK